jgi:hypothetical protein
MKNDISRDTFDPAKHFTRVLMQQGRVQLDADSNEQTDLFWHYIRMLATDIIGPFGGPRANLGFGIVRGTDTSHLTDAEQAHIANDEGLDRVLRTLPPNEFSFVVTRGRYYVDGLAAENEANIVYQPLKYYPKLSPSEAFIIYLDVWERHVSALEDDSIREVALGGPDTATRAQLVWQIRVYTQADDDDRVPTDTRGARKKPISALTDEEIWDGWPLYADYFQSLDHGRLSARVKSGDGAATEPCIIHPDALYRGAENQLYRVEIHTRGSGDVATFKWSRENGSVTFPILEMNGGLVRLAYLGRDSHLGLQVNDWVEIVDDDRALAPEAGPLFQVAEVRPMDSEITLKVPTGGSLPVYKREDQGRHPYLRRWDQRRDVNGDGVVVIKKSGAWIDLEDNVQIKFEDPPNARYRAGDYWLIPARTTTRNVEWPRDNNGDALPLPPRGVRHHYAPLALWAPAALSPSADAGVSTEKKTKKEAAKEAAKDPAKDAASISIQPPVIRPLRDLRRVFKSLTETA